MKTLLDPKFNQASINLAEIYVLKNDRDKVEFYFAQLQTIPEVYLYLIFIVVGGNYGISVTNLLTNKKFKK